MAISPYLAALRTKVGHDLVVLPAVAVLPFDDKGRLLLVRQSDSGLWATVGGSVEPDESPWDAAVREAHEETGVNVALRGVRTVLGGPGFRTTYANGDECSYVSIVFDADVVSGEARPDGDETLDTGWFLPAEIARLELQHLNRVLLTECGLCPREPAVGT